MDVNGSRFHLIRGKPDWQACVQVAPDGGRRDVYWDEHAQAVTLTPVLSLFRPHRAALPLPVETRRGAAADRFGNWYWIGQDGRTIYWTSPGVRARVFWAQAEPPCDTPASAFRPQPASDTAPADLAGLAVTEHHYLVVGNVTAGGVFIFDLTAGGEPMLILFPREARFEPFDMAPAPGGGVWILDRMNRAYWGLDRAFRVMPDPDAPAPVSTERPSAFRPARGAATVRQTRPAPAGFRLDPDIHDPIAIEGLRDGSVLILDRQGASGASALSRYRFGRRLAGPTPLADPSVEVQTDDTLPVEHLAVVAHDMAYVDAGQTLYVVDEVGKQAVAFTLDAAKTPLSLTGRAMFYPLYAWGGRGLVAADGLKTETGVFYDVGGRDPTPDAKVTWVELRAIDEPRYEPSATITLGSPTGAAYFDSRERDCVWHRLFLDACIPPETRVEVWSRAANDAALLDNLPFQPEPDLYLRSAGTEIPYYTAFGGSDLPAGTGTWETVFQEARGRFIQVMLVVTGNGRASPQLRAVRFYYPRFSYPRRYLPSAYLEDGESAGFLERLLANPEGFYTEIEGKIALVGALFDARSAPADALDWLATWWGLLLDPLWEQIQARRQAAGSGQTPAGVPSAAPPDRRRLFIRFARKLYDRRGTPEGIRFALALLLDGCLERNLQAFKEAAVTYNPTLAARLADLGLPYPTPVMSDDRLEDLLYDFTLSPCRPSKIRLVEWFATRDGRAAAAGDPTPSAGPNTVEASAHQFSVMVPEGLSPAEQAMVERIVRLERPAHTNFDVRRYFDLFRVGEARLGLDTVIGEESRFVPLILGWAVLSQGYLAAASPLDALDRVVSDRDRLGAMPPL